MVMNGNLEAQLCFPLQYLHYVKRKTFMLHLDPFSQQCLGICLVTNKKKSVNTAKVLAIYCSHC